MLTSHTGLTVGLLSANLTRAQVQSLTPFETQSFGLRIQRAASYTPPVLHFRADVRQLCRRKRCFNRLLTINAVVLADAVHGWVGRGETTFSRRHFKAIYRVPPIRTRRIGLSKAVSVACLYSAHFFFRAALIRRW